MTKSKKQKAPTPTRRDALGRTPDDPGFGVLPYDMSDIAPKKRAVLVTTEARGVFFGYLTGEPSPDKIIITNARNVLYWSVSMRGFGGLAAQGPNAECRIGPAMPDATLYKITGVFGCTEVAAQAFEAAPWRG